MSGKEERKNDVLWAIEKMDSSHGVTKEEIGKHLLLQPIDSIQLDETLKHLVESESVYECSPDFPTLPKTPKRYKVMITG